MLLRFSLSFSVLLCHLVLGIPFLNDNNEKPTLWTDLVYNNPVKNPSPNTYIEYTDNSEPKNEQIDYSGAMVGVNNEIQPAPTDANRYTSNLIENKVDSSKPTDLNPVNPESVPQANVINENTTPNQNGLDAVVQSSFNQPVELMDNNTGLSNVKNLKQVNNSGQEFTFDGGNFPVAEKKPIELEQNTFNTQTLVPEQQTTLYNYEFAQPSTVDQQSPPTLTDPFQNIPMEEKNTNGISAVHDVPEPPTINTVGLDLNKDSSQINQPVYSYEPILDPINSQPTFAEPLSDQRANIEQSQSIGFIEQLPKNAPVEQLSHNVVAAPITPQVEYTEKNQEVAFASPQQIEKVWTPNIHLAELKYPNVDGVKDVPKADAPPTTTESTPNVPASSALMEPVPTPVYPVVPTPFIAFSNDLSVPAEPQSEDVQEVLVPTSMEESTKSPSPIAGIPEQPQTIPSTETFTPTFETPSIQAQPIQESEPMPTEESSLLEERLEKIESLLREYNDKQNVGSSAVDVVLDIDTDAQHDTKSISENITQPLDNNLAGKQTKETNDNLGNKVFKLVVEEEEATSTLKPQPTVAQSFKGAEPFDPSNTIKLPNGSWVPSCKNVSKGKSNIICKQIKSFNCVSVFRK